MLAMPWSTMYIAPSGPILTSIGRSMPISGASCFEAGSMMVGNSVEG